MNQAMTAMPGTDPAIFAGSRCVIDAMPDGAFVVRNTLALRPYPSGVFQVLKQRATLHPKRILYRESDAAGIVDELTFEQAFNAALKIGSSFLQLGASAERPVALISDNCIRMAIAVLGCYAAGVPIAPISPSYSKLSSDFGKLRHVLAALTPALVILDDGAQHARAIATLEWGDIKLAAMDRAPASALAWDELIGSGPGLGVMPAVDPDAVAKILFTSGSTGMPKGVVNTQRMMMSNQQALAQLWPGIFSQPPRLVDWLPWNHTYGGNQLFNMPIVFGGSLTIDRGRPTAAGIATMVQSIRRTRPTLFLNVPRALDMLADRLAEDDGFAADMFGDLDLIGYAGAALPRPVSERLSGISRKVKGRNIPVVGLWGSTETAPVATAVSFASSEPANIGLPVPGCEIKFVPDRGKLEMRVRGPGVTPGYWRQRDATAKAFDADGFYKMGDAGRLVDPQDINAGLLFDGRVAENFKLTSGTWVDVGSLRVKLIAAGVDLIADAVIAGHDRAQVCALIFPKFDACRQLTGGREIASRDGLLTGSAILDAIGTALRLYNQTAGGSSNRIARAAVMLEPPSVDAGEITDKGYLNQRCVLERRVDLVEHLYATEPVAGVIEIQPNSPSGQSGK
jgi:feruloyl-CoA synthase